MSQSYANVPHLLFFPVCVCVCLRGCPNCVHIGDAVRRGSQLILTISETRSGDEECTALRLPSSPYTPSHAHVAPQRKDAGGLHALRDESGCEADIR